MSFLKPFQMKIYEELNSLMTKNDVVMLAAATGSGKTEMMCQFIADNPRLRVLILAHGQKALRANFSDRLFKYDIESIEMGGRSDKRDVDLANKARVVVALPQNVHNKLKYLERFDVIIVDEAHEFYLPKDNSVMYPKIKAWHKGKWILLSASHYRVDAEKVFFSRENALAVGQIADASLKLIEEDAKIKDEDISKDGFLKEKVKVPTSVRVISKVLKENGRTPAIVAKHSVAAAMELATDLAKVYKGRVCVSDASSDPLGENLEAFKAGKYDVCIVVYRGNLGFDYPAMATFIDGTYTTNIQRMEQMLGRVVRKGGEGDDKKFIKLVPADAWTRGVLLGTAVLALSKDEVYQEWSGDEAKIKLPGKPADLIGNLNGRTKGESFEEGEASGEGGEGGESSHGLGEGDESLGEDYGIGGPVKKGTLKKGSVGNGKEGKEQKMRTRKTLELSFGHLVGMFGGGDSCTLRQAINNAGVGSGHDVEGKKKELMEWDPAKRPSGTSKDERERKLASSLLNYIGESSKTYDPDFIIEIKKAKPLWFVDTVAINKQKLMEWDPAKRPNNKSNDEGERKLAASLSGYTRDSHGTYDPDFTIKIKKDKPLWFVDKVALNKQKLMEWDPNKRPSASSKDEIESKLGASLSRYTTESINGSYDHDFTIEIKKAKPLWFVDTVALNKQRLMEWDPNKRPKASSKDKIESKLSSALSGYIRDGSGTYDQDFTVEIKKAKPLWFVDTVAINKQKLMEWDSNKKPSTSSKDEMERKLGHSLLGYIREGYDMYDPDFTAEIKKAKPLWFVDTVALNKQRLMEWDSNKRPSTSSKDERERKLATYLYGYTREGDAMYDPDFFAEIKKAKPLWKWKS